MPQDAAPRLEGLEEPIQRHWHAGLTIDAADSPPLSSPASPYSPEADPYAEVEDRTLYLLRVRARLLEAATADPRAAEHDEESRFLIHRLSLRVR
jgi:hypothetical protein